MIGFAVVGLGMGKNRARTIIDTEGAELRAVVDLDASLAESVGTEMETEWLTNIDHVLARDDVDVIMVMTPSGSHADVGCRVAAAGKHVVTTKPMDVSTEACDRLIRGYIRISQRDEVGEGAVVPGMGARLECAEPLRNLLRDV